MNIRQASKINKKTIEKNNYTKNQLNKAQQILRKVNKWALKDLKQFEERQWQCLNSLK